MSGRGQCAAALDCKKSGNKVVACSRPLKGYRASRVNRDTRKRSIVFNPREGLLDQPVDLPCGKCIFCRLEHSRQNAMRCVHEASLYEQNCFVTLTYSSEHLPANGSIDPEAPVLWMKRLRKRFEDIRIRSFDCAEYGDENERPHYHILLFNLDFEDKYLWRVRDGFRYYRSPVLEDLWPYGNSEITDLTFETAAYVARYVTKKLDFGGVECTRVRFVDGRCVPMEHERAVCVSRRPGIGREWLAKFGETDVFSNDRVVMRGQVMRPPKYYDRVLEKLSPKTFSKLRKKRKWLALQNGPRRDDADRRWQVLELCKEASFKMLKRGFDHG